VFHLDLHFSVAIAVIARDDLTFSCWCSSGICEFVFACGCCKRQHKADERENNELPIPHAFVPHVQPLRFVHVMNFPHGLVAGGARIESEEKEQLLRGRTGNSVYGLPQLWRMLTWCSGKL
jgi:hypothetical protein